MITPDPLTLEEFRRAHWLALRTPLSRVLTITTTILYGIAVLLALLNWWQLGKLPVKTWALLAGAPALSLLYILGLDWQLKRRYRSAGNTRQQSMEISPEGLRIVAEHGDTLLPWEQLHGWKVDHHVVLAYRTDEEFFIFVRRWFATDEDFAQLRSYLHGALGRQRA